MTEADRFAPDQWPQADLSSRRRFLSGMLLAPGLLSQAAWAQGPVRSQDRAGLELVTPETRVAIRNGLTWLARAQQTQGESRGTFGTSGYSAGVAICGLAGLAFLASGSVPGRGPYGKHLERCIDFLIGCVDGNGYISSRLNSGMDTMYGHGFATLFLAEACGMSSRASRNEQLLKRLKSAVELLIHTQNDQGGWRYQPVKSSDADLSIVICQIMALRAARDAGLHVPDQVRNRCIDYVLKSHNRDGGFAYVLPAGDRSSSFALAAAGVVALNSAGINEGKEVDSALQFLWKQRPSGQINDGHFFYGQYYAALAMWHAGGTYWSGWYPAIRDLLLKFQKGDGSWQDPSVSHEFGTAMALIILQLPYNFVPVFGEG